MFAASQGGLPILSRTLSAINHPAHSFPYPTTKCYRVHRHTVQQMNFDP
jgi:hypothetical protein